MARLPESHRCADIARVLVGRGDPWSTIKGIYVWAYGITASVIALVMIWEALYGGPSLLQPPSWPSHDLATPIVVVVEDQKPSPEATPYVPFVPVATPRSSANWDLGCHHLALSYGGLSEPSTYYHYDPETGASCVSRDVDDQPNPWDALGH